MISAYIASPYTHEEENIMESRYKQVSLACKYLINNYKGIAPYSPIVHWHQIAKDYKLPKDFLFWQKLNTVAIAQADVFVGLTLHGWEESKGFADDLRIATKLGKTCRLASLDHLRLGKPLL